MSTFGGKIKELPYVSVDRFDKEHLYSEVYFLSHCHSDHMRGLENQTFWDNLVRYKKFLYASEVSCKILHKKYAWNTDNVKVLDVYTPTTIVLNQNSFSVFIISAGHCPGSVMFLFVNNSQRILYTGDFRINKNDIKKFKAFRNDYKEIYVVDKIYLDTTFFSKSYQTFPKREDSLREVCRVINEHIQKGKQFMIHLSTGAFNYGYEYLFNEIFKKIEMPVHVTEGAYNFYRLLPELDSSVTMDGSKTQIHCNCAGYDKICDFSLESILLKVRVSAMIWNSELLKHGISYCDYKNGTYYICYSTHASLEESTELIRFLCPKEIEICVESKTPAGNDEMRDIINDLLQDINLPKICEPQPGLFNTGYKIKKRKYEGCSNINTTDILQSPPREKRLHPHSLSSIEEYKSSPEKNSFNPFPKRRASFSDLIDQNNKSFCLNLEKNKNDHSEITKRPNVSSLYPVKTEISISSCSNAITKEDFETIHEEKIELASVEEDYDILKDILYGNNHELLENSESCNLVEETDCNTFEDLIKTLGLLKTERSTESKDSDTHESQGILSSLLTDKPNIS